MVWGRAAMQCASREVVEGARELETLARVASYLSSYALATPCPVLRWRMRRAGAAGRGGSSGEEREEGAGGEGEGEARGGRERDQGEGGEHGG
eukprot:2711857-Rhodomonas_salina.1